MIVIIILIIKTMIIIMIIIIIIVAIIICTQYDETIDIVHILINTLTVYNIIIYSII